MLWPVGWRGGAAHAPGCSKVLINKYWDKFSTVEAPIDYYGISVYKKYLKVSNKLDKPLFIWGANEKDVIQKLVKDGVAGIMTDRPDLF